MAKQPDSPKKTDQDTERYVLVGAAIDVKDMMPTVSGGDLTQPDGTVVAWVPVVDEKGEPRVFKGTKRGVIDQFTGTGEDARPGVYKAPTVSSMRGQRTIVLPEKPKPEALWED